MKTKTLILLSSLILFAGCASKETPAIVKSPPIICKSPGPQFRNIEIAGVQGTKEIQDEILLEAKKLNMIDPASDKVFKVAILLDKGCSNSGETTALFVGAVAVKLFASLAGIQNEADVGNIGHKINCSYKAITGLEEASKIVKTAEIYTDTWIEHHFEDGFFLNKAMAEAQANAIMCKVIDAYWPQKEDLVKP